MEKEGLQGREDPGRAGQVDVRAVAATEHFPRSHRHCPHGAARGWEKVRREGREEERREEEGGGGREEALRRRGNSRGGGLAFLNILINFAAG